MSAAYRSHANTSWTSRTNTTITAPSGIADGDILVLFFLIGASTPGSPPTPTLPSGFTALGSPPYNSGTADSFSVDLHCAYKVASGESGNYTVSHSSASSQGSIVCVSGGDTGGTPQFTHAGSTGSTSTATGITTSADNAWVGWFGHNWAGYGAASPPTGTTPTFTERIDNGLTYHAEGTLATAGATGDKSHSNLNSPSSRPWQACLVGIEPAGAAGGVFAPYYYREHIGRCA